MIRDYPAQKAPMAFKAEAHQQSLAIATRARDPSRDGARVMAGIEATFERDKFEAAWEA